MLQLAARAVALVLLTATMAAAQLPASSVSIHGVGAMAMSPDGACIAFYTNSMPGNQFALLNLSTRQAILIEAPASHEEIGDLTWSPDGDELTFVTADKDAVLGSILGGMAKHVWRLRQSPLTVELLAIIPHVRLPALSSDGSRLAAFEGVVPADAQYDMIGLAYGLFERSLIDGKSTKRSDGYADVVWRLMYDRQDALVLSLFDPVFLKNPELGAGEQSHLLWVGRDATGRWSYAWQTDIRQTYAFRIAPGETLPSWPEPFPPRGLPAQAALLRPLNDGRIVVYGPLDPTRLPVASDWYNERGLPKTPTRTLSPYGYVAVTGNGVAEVLPTPQLPENVGRSGGADVSGDGRLYAEILDHFDNQSVGGGRGDDTLFVYERGSLLFKAKVAALIDHANIARAQLTDSPVVPIESLETRRASPSAP